jgi:hypothetical protein
VALARPGLPPVYVAAESVEYYESLGVQRERPEAEPAEDETPAKPAKAAKAAAKKETP